MPQWGLTKELRETEPWGIPQKWLKPSKIVTDPIHGDIYLSKFERAMVDSEPFQRLRRIRQLGTVHLAYPGATHTRFSHALGALRVVQDLLDIILEQRNGRDPEHDLFAQWESDFGAGSKKFERHVAETIVFARLGTLLHDVCHVAYGHTIEDDLDVLVPHDENQRRFDDFWQQLGGNEERTEYRDLRRILKASGLKKALDAVILSKASDVPADERLRRMGKFPFVADLVTNTICADLLDYLPRDHVFTGLPVGLGQRFMTAFYVVPHQEKDEERLYPERMALRISHHGRERQDISSELLKHLRYRYELQERTIVHHAKLAADAMLGKALQFWHEGLWLAQCGKLDGPELRRARKLGGYERMREALAADEGGAAPGKLDAAVGEQLEQRIRDLGDDGMLEYLAGHFGDGGPAVDLRARALAADLLNRRLYKRAAQATGRSDRQLLFDRFGKPAKRRELERKAAAYVRASEDKVAIWLPDPKMRLKTAEVLVDFGEGIAPFKKVSTRGEEIYRDHEELWTITVFVHEDLRRKGHEPAILARLAELMGVEWDMHKPPGAKRPADWPLARELANIETNGLTEEDVGELLKSPEAHAIVHRGEELTQIDVRRDARKLARRFKPAKQS